MIKQKLKLVLGIIFIMSLYNTSWAQAGQVQNQQKGYYNNSFQMLDLSQSQKDKIKALRVETMNNTKLLRNKLKEERLILNKMIIADKVNQKAIDNKIDDISLLQTKLLKLRVKLRLEIRSILTKEQREYLDNHHAEMMKNRAMNNSNSKKGKRKTN